MRALAKYPIKRPIECQACPLMIKVDIARRDRGPSIAATFQIENPER
jgi:hypothetical protein